MTTKPRVGFDGLFLENPMTGMGQYSLHLWRELQRRDDFDAVLLMPSDAPRSVHELASGRGCVVGPPAGSLLPGKARKLWWEQFGVVAATRKANVDLVHIPYFSAPLRQAVPHIVTIHDTIPFVMKEYAGGWAMRRYLTLVSRTAVNASLILTDSIHSAADIQRYLGIAADRIRPIPLAAGSQFSPSSGSDDEARIAEVRERLGLGRPFALNVGGFDRRKNLPALVEGFAMARPEIGQDIDLVIVGSAHSANTGLFPPLGPIVQRYGVTDRVKLAGFVSEEDKLALYRAADVFVFTSGYEGFGLNPLEAMACGTPVISSNRSSLPEVVGNGGILIEPRPIEIARALVALLNDTELQASMRQRGLEQARRFSWRETARQTANAYGDVLESAK